MATTAKAITNGKRKREGGLYNSSAKRPATSPARSNETKTSTKTSTSKSTRQTLGQADAKLNGGSVIPVELQTESKTGPPSSKAVTNGVADEGPLHVQMITGSYERILHGVAATIPRHLLNSQTEDDTFAVTKPQNEDSVAFSDTFLFAAHASAIRCLSVSPSTESNWRYLATGSSDERINVYSISTAPPDTSGAAKLPSFASNPTAENPRNKSLGTLIHHDRGVTCLQFPAKGKLFSAAEDNTVAISRTRDWTMLSSIKAPIPKPQGRPSGDTAAPGQTPAGVNDFAIHPSQKLMLSVGRGERCLRLWNLMTGKKAGVLNFDRDLLAQVGESRHSSGEGRSVLWAGDGESYFVGFERGAALFGVDSQPRAIIKPSPPTKLHCYRMLPVDNKKEVLAVSTEDGRILFFDTANAESTDNDKNKLPTCHCIAQLGGSEAGVAGRIKDFAVIDSGAAHSSTVLIVAASSDGAIRLWTIPRMINNSSGTTVQQTGRLIGTLETSNRITCLDAFVLDGAAGLDETSGLNEEEFGGFDDEVGGEI
ncbi:hypothetical protein LTR62_000650 [Meristemomyces frigidus]|uniref:WD40 repeat-like protein n=1 Tax=Meristemomyces frigidus TaxID=1508187 RepID=A0AAN7YLH2_9PEZI|nr:hypothetical protein LTR62_000650 [Meristemomyces frigidus]